MDKCNALTLLKEHELKVTKQRKLLLDEIIEIEESFSANTLYQNMHNEMDMATVYRILNIFKEKRIIREILSIDDTKYFELSCIHHPVHPHFFCKKCNNIVCLDQLKDQDLMILKKYSQDLTIDDIKISFTGLCNKCK